MTAWAVLAAAVVAIDVTTIRTHRPTLSQEFAAAARAHPAAVAAATAWMVAHLIGVLPATADPLHQAAEWLRAHTPPPVVL